MFVSFKTGNKEALWYVSESGTQAKQMQVEFLRRLNAQKKAKRFRCHIGVLVAYLMCDT